MKTINASTLAFLPGLACLALVLAAAAAYRGSVARAIAATRFASILSLAAAIAAAATLGTLGPATSTLLGGGGVGIAFRLDPLSVFMFLLIAFIGHLIFEYSRSYLAGNDRQAEFFGHLALTIAAALFMTNAGNLAHLVAGWIATSLALHRLLLFFHDRPRARVAARKKFIVARIGDVSLAAGAVLLWQAFGTADIASLLDMARAGDVAATNGPLITAATLLIAVAAILKSAQFPAHGWIAEVMETPTPVSALLHAGIVNAGGFLVFRFADVIVLNAASMQLLAIVGGFTALFGSLVMTTQSNIKVTLAYSTVAQMGFMLLQCGFGAFSSAGLHLAAHSLYKAHGFLASGTAVDDVATVSAVADSDRPGIGKLVISLGIALVIFAGIGRLFAHDITSSLAVQTLGAIYIVGLFVFLAKGAGTGALLLRVAPVASVAALLYFTLQIGAASYFGSQVPPIPAPSSLDRAIAVLVVLSFAAISLLQLVKAPGQSRWFQKAWVLMNNGLYANAIFSRFTGAFRRDLAR